MPGLTAALGWTCPGDIRCPFCLEPMEPETADLLERANAERAAQGIPPLEPL